MTRVLWFLAALLVAVSAQAQAPAPPPDAAAPPSAEQTRTLIDTLENDASRAKLVAELKQLLAAQQAAQQDTSAQQGAFARVVSTLSNRIERISERLVEGADIVVDLPRLGTWAQNQTSDPAMRARWLASAWRVVVVFLAGVIAGWLVHAALARARHAVESRTGDSVWLRIVRLLAWTVLDLVPIGAFAAAAYIVLPLTDPTRTARLIALALINAVVIAQIVSAAARLVFMPRVEGLRVLPLRDEDSVYGYIWTRRLAFVAVYGWGLAESALLLGLPPAGHEALIKIVGLIVTALAVVLILQSRHSVAAWIRGPRGTGEPAHGWRILRARAGDIWHVLAIIYALGLYAVWALDIENGFRYVGRATALTIVILLGARLAAVALRQGLRGVFSISDEIRRRYPGIERRANRYLAILQSTGMVLIYLIAVFAVLAAWGVDTLSWLEGDFGRRAIGRAILVAIVIVAAVVAWEVVNGRIERRLAEGAPDLGARARTLLPLGRSVAAIVIATVALFTILSEIGLDIGPLLAGAGVIGLAIGFGSQTLVKDIVTGVFILLENQITVGDVVKTGDQSGLVEAITIRTLRLRDFDGTVRIIPFSAVTTVENMTKDFSRYVFDVGVSYREDVDEVAEILKEIGAEMQADPKFADRILGPLEIFGLDKFDDSAVIVKARITTKPIAQWEIGREFNRRIKQKFDERGIEIPFPHRTIYFGIDKEGKAPPARVEMEGKESRDG